MAKVHYVLEMWQGSQNLCATCKKSRAQLKLMMAMGYILDTQEIIQVSWSLFQYDYAAAFKLSQRPPLPPPVSAKDLPGGPTQIISDHRIRRINCHPVECDEGSAPESISEIEDWLTWNGDLDNPNYGENDCVVDIESDMNQDSCIKDPESPEQRDVSATPNLP
jgi:hypothetical protein